MATQHPDQPQPVDTIEEDINHFFNRIVACVNFRRKTLLAEAKEKREEKRAKLEREEQSEKQLLATKTDIERNLKDNLFQETHKEILAKLEEKLAEVRLTQPETRLIFQGDSEQLEQLILGLGEVITKQIESEIEAFSSEFTGKRISIELNESVLGLVENLGRVVVTECSAEVSIRDNYKGKRTPVLSVGGRASGEGGLFNSPRGVAVEYKTGNIYVADYSNNRVQVFDSNGKHLRTFGDKMNGPHSITINQNRVLVSQSLGAHCVLVYQLNGTFIKQLGSRGSGVFRFNCPRGIAISEINGDIYVCDRDNNRIQILSKEFLFKSQFGQGTLKSPCDIKLTNEFICVLSFSQPFLYSFSYKFTPTYNSVLSSISKHLRYPQSFCIDRSGHFIIADSVLNAVFIFNQQGELVHTITVYGPRGVTLDSNGRIILVGDNHCLLIF